MGHLRCLRPGIVRPQRGSQRGKNGDSPRFLAIGDCPRFSHGGYHGGHSESGLQKQPTPEFPMKMTTPVDNGVNVEALLGARQALTDMPEAAQFKWRATCEWIRGTHSRSTVQTYFGLGTEHSHKTAFKYDTDHPAVFASEDKGSTPVEMVLVGLAGCLTAGIAAVAQNRK